MKTSEITCSFVEENFAYDGSQLRHLFAYEKFGILGTSLVAWTGSCHVPFEKMVDGEDKFSRSEIRGDHMLHFIGEFFHQDIYFSVALQRLFASIVFNEILRLKPELAQQAELSGDDIFLKNKKLSISIASISAFSSMLHFAVNIESKGTPVPTISLSELSIPVESLVQSVFTRFEKEYSSLVQATQKIFFLS